MMKSRAHGGAEKRISTRWIIVLCLASFGIGMLFTNRFPDLNRRADSNAPMISQRRKEQELHVVSEDCAKSLDNTISTLQMELAATRSSHDLPSSNGSPTIIASGCLKVSS